jgi:NAD-dependent dihydropyrimidine dehydrogenase PreA subunit
MRSRCGHGSTSHTYSFSGRRRHSSKGASRGRPVGWLGAPPLRGSSHPYRVRVMPAAPGVSTRPRLDRQTTRPVPAAHAPVVPERVVASVNATKCSGCGTCASVCPAGAVTLCLTAQVDPAKCIGCGRCANYCPSGAISLG